MKKAKNAGMVAGQWFALLRKPDALPVLFASRQDAVDNLDYDEYLVPVIVRPASLRDLGRGERAVLDRKRAASGALVELKGYIPALECSACRETFEASEFVKLCKMTGGTLALRLGTSCNRCAPSWPIPFVAGLRFLNSLGRNVTWRQRTRRRGLFGPELKLSEMELRRMTGGKPGARPVLRPQPRLIRHRKIVPRPRVPDTEKVRRGSVRVAGAGLLRSALKRMAPRMRQRFADAIEKETRAFAGMDLAKGPDRSAEIRVTRGKVVSHRFIKNAIKNGAKRAAAPRSRR